METFGSAYYNIYGQHNIPIRSVMPIIDPIRQRMEEIASQRLNQRIADYESMQSITNPYLIGSGVGGADGVYCGPGKIPKGKKLGTAKQCIQNKQLRYWGVKKVDPTLLQGINDEITAEKAKNASVKAKLKLKKLEDDAKILVNTYKKLKIRLDSAIEKGKKHKALDSEIVKLLARRDRLIKNIKKQREVVKVLLEMEEEQANEPIEEIDTFDINKQRKLLDKLKQNRMDAEQRERELFPDEEDEEDEYVDLNPRAKVTKGKFIIDANEGFGYGGYQGDIIIPQVGFTNDYPDTFVFYDPMNPLPQVKTWKLPDFQTRQNIPNYPQTSGSYSRDNYNDDIYSKMEVDAGIPQLHNQKQIF